MCELPKKRCPVCRGAIKEIDLSKNWDGSNITYFCANCGYSIGEDDFEKFDANLSELIRNISELLKFSEIANRALLNENKRLKKELESEKR